MNAASGVTTIPTTFTSPDKRHLASLLPPCVENYVAHDALVRLVDAFAASLNLADLGFGRAVAAATGRPRYHPGVWSGCTFGATSTNSGPHATWNERVSATSKRSG
jgi:hypothetical protein